MAEYADALWPGASNGATRAERRPCAYRAYVPDPLIGRPLTLTAQRSADIADVERQILALNASEQTLVGLEAR